MCVNFRIVVNSCQEQVLSPSSSLQIVCGWVLWSCMHVLVTSCLHLVYLFHYLSQSSLYYLLFHWDVVWKHQQSLFVIYILLSCVYIDLSCMASMCRCAVRNYSLTQSDRVAASAFDAVYLCVSYRIKILGHPSSVAQGRHNIQTLQSSVMY